MSVRGRGQGIDFLRAHVNDPDGPCLIWPLSRLPTGYGHLGYLGRMNYAHRLMCELAHGPAPELHQAAHSCGNGHLGCVHPKHLSWKTIRENLLDRRVHGTAEYGGTGGVAILTPKEIAEVRALKGYVSQYKLAEDYGVKRPVIQYWHKHDRPGAGRKRRTKTAATMRGSFR